MYIRTSYIKVLYVSLPTEVIKQGSKRGSTFQEVLHTYFRTYVSLHGLA